jgi:transcriptional regulator with XRE-family HTH domain
MSQATNRRAAARCPLDHDPVALRRRRVELGLSQAEVAAAASISAGHLCELEGGTRNPSPAVLRILAEVLSCTTTDLMPATPVAVS